jgi:hypothetical protein
MIQSLWDCQKRLTPISLQSARPRFPSPSNQPILIIHGSFHTFPRGWFRRMWRETGAGRSNCKNRRFFHRVRRRVRWPRPPALRKRGLGSWFSIDSSSGHLFAGSLCHSVAPNHFWDTLSRTRRLRHGVKPFLAFQVWQGNSCQLLRNLASGKSDLRDWGEHPMAGAFHF